MFLRFEDVLSIIFLASKSSLTVSPYQLIFPETLPFKLLLRRLNNSVCVSSFFRRADRIAVLTVSYIFLSIFFPLLPSGCFVSVFSAVIFLLFFLILLFVQTFMSLNLTSMRLGRFWSIGHQSG